MATAWLHQDAARAAAQAWVVGNVGSWASRLFASEQGICLDWASSCEARRAGASVHGRSWAACTDCSMALEVHCRTTAAEAAGYDSTKTAQGWDTKGEGLTFL